MCFAFLRDPNGEVGGSPDSETRPCTFEWANGTNERVGNRCLPGQSLVVQLFFLPALDKNHPYKTEMKRIKLMSVQHFQ